MESRRFLVLVSRADGRRRRSTVSVFGDADEAKQEFCRLEERVQSTGGSVELAAVDPHGRVTRLCRSGPRVPAQRATSASASVGADPMWTCT